MFNLKMDILELQEKLELEQLTLEMCDVFSPIQEKMEYIAEEISQLYSEVDVFKKAYDSVFDGDDNSSLAQSLLALRLAKEHFDDASMCALATIADLEDDEELCKELFGE